MEFPVYVFRKAKTKREDGSKFDTLLVQDIEQRIDALNDGWYATVIEALDRPQSKEAEEESIQNEDRPPTREELEYKATELGLKFDGRTSDRKLSALIAETLGG